MEILGKTVLITGSTDGVGRYVARHLAFEGANVRSMAATKAARKR